MNINDIPKEPKEAVKFLAADIIGTLSGQQMKLDDLRGRNF